MHSQWFGNIPKSEEIISKGVRFMKVKNPQKLGLQHIK